MKCYICKSEMEYKTVVFPNRKWGSKEDVVFPEEIEVWVCENCDEMIIPQDKAHKLLELAKNYK